MFLLGSVQQNIFEKTLIEVGSSHLYASFGTFCVQIGQLFEAQGVYEKCMKNSKIAVFEGKWRRFRILPKVWSLTSPRIIDQFGHKTCQKKRKDVSYPLLLDFFQKHSVIHERSAVKNSLSTYVWSKIDSCFCEAV